MPNDYDCDNQKDSRMNHSTSPLGKRILETLTALPQSMYEDASASAELGVIRLTCPESGQGCVDVWPMHGK